MLIMLLCKSGSSFWGSRLNLVVWQFKRKLLCSTSCRAVCLLDLFQAGNAWRPWKRQQTRQPQAQNIYINLVIVSTFPYSACGNSEDSITVMSNAVQTAVTCSALGVLICDWSLPGHVNPLSVSIPALLAGAGLAWKADVELVSCVISLLILET